MWGEEDQSKVAEHSQNAINYFQRADRIDPQFELSLVGKGTMFLATKDNRADRFIGSALKTSPDNITALLGQGLLYFQKGKFKKAQECYQQAIQSHPMLNNPKLASRMRMCYAYCCYKMGSYMKAERAMVRANSLDQLNEESLIGSALCALRRKKAFEKLRVLQDPDSEFVAMIQRAHGVNGGNPTVLNHLANHLFLQWHVTTGTVKVLQGSRVVYTTDNLTGVVVPGQMIQIEAEGGKHVVYISSETDAVKSHSITLDHDYVYSSQPEAKLSHKKYPHMVEMARRAYHSTQSDRIKAESCYLMARTAHAQRNWETASSFYLRAVNNWPEYSLPAYNLAQVSFEMGKREEATAFLEKATRHHPENVDLLMLNGYFSGLKGDMEAAKASYQRVSELDPGHGEAMMRKAELLQFSKNPKHLKAAIASYKAAETILQDAMESTPTEMYVNLGVLYHTTDQPTKAMESYIKALSLTILDTETNIESHDDIETLPVQEKNVTILYNVGLLLEKTGDRDKARALYERILDVFPHYIECTLRIGCIHRDKGDTAVAATFFERAMALDPSCADACALHGNLHLEKGEWNYAQKKFEAIMGMPTLRNDPYALLSMGNIYVSNLDENTEKNLKRSEGYFRKILQTQPNNLYAANGLGIVLAEKGHLSAAKLVFSQVREAAPEMPDAWINLAHIYMVEDRLAEAIQLYSVCLAQCYHGQDVELMMYLGRAYYESHKYDDAIRILSKAVHMDQTHLQCWYNLGYVLEDYAVKTLRDEIPGRIIGERTIKDVEKAIANLKRAEQIFLFLVKFSEDGTNVPYDKEKASEIAVFCSGTLSRAHMHLEFEKSKEGERLANLEKKMVLIEENRKKKEIEEEKKLKVLQEDASKRGVIAERKQARLIELSQNWQQQAVAQQEKVASKHSKKRKKSEIEKQESEESSSEDEEAGKRKLLRRKKLPTKSQADKELFGFSSEDEDILPTGVSKETTEPLAGRMVLDDDDDDDDNTPVAPPDNNDSRMIVDDEDDDTPVAPPDNHDSDDDDTPVAPPDSHSEDDDTPVAPPDSHSDDDDDAPVAPPDKHSDDDDDTPVAPPDTVVSTEKNATKSATDTLFGPDDSSDDE